MMGIQTIQNQFVIVESLVRGALMAGVYKSEYGAAFQGDLIGRTAMICRETNACDAREFSRTRFACTRS